MNSRNQTFVIYLLLFMAIITMLFFNFQQQAAEVRTIPINQLARNLSREVPQALLKLKNRVL